jgi:hypothetical protein
VERKLLARHFLDYQVDATTRADERRGKTASLGRVALQQCGRSSRLIPCLCDGIELLAISRDRVILDAKDRARPDELN